MVRAAPCVADEVRGPAADFACAGERNTKRAESQERRGLAPPDSGLATRARLTLGYRRPQDVLRCKRVSQDSDAVRAPCPVLLWLGSHG